MHHSNDPSPTNLSRYDLGDESPSSLLSGRAKLGGRVPTSGVLGEISGFMGEYWPKVANVVWQYSKLKLINLLPMLASGLSESPVHTYDMS